MGHRNAGNGFKMCVRERERKKEWQIDKERERERERGRQREKERERERERERGRGNETKAGLLCVCLRAWQEKTLSRTFLACLNFFYFCG